MSDSETSEKSCELTLGKFTPCPIYAILSSSDGFNSLTEHNQSALIAAIKNLSGSYVDAEDVAHTIAASDRIDLATVKAAIVKFHEAALLINQCGPLSFD